MRFRKRAWIVTLIGLFANSPLASAEPVDGPLVYNEAATVQEATYDWADYFTCDDSCSRGSGDDHGSDPDRWTSKRPDGHAPIGVMWDHMHEKGEYMLSYRYMRMRMAGKIG